MPVSVREQLLQAAADDPGRRIMAAFDNDTEAALRQNLDEFGDQIGAGKFNSMADTLGVENTAGMMNPYSFTFIDYKLHDIDETMRKRARNLALGGANIITLHALADVEPMKQAKTGLDEAVADDPTLERPMLLAITVLTSHKEDRCISLFGEGRLNMVKKLALMAVDAGIEGLVCSPEEVEMIKSDRRTEDLVVVTPAIRPSWAVKRDEQETAETPRIALEAGADFLVIGRPLIESRTYNMTGSEAFESITDEIREVTA
jgi:orotidine-5'-phosphate decarboxylase